MALRLATGFVVLLILAAEFVESSRLGSPSNHTSPRGAKHSSHGGATKHRIKAKGTQTWRTPLWRRDQKRSMHFASYNESAEERSLEQMVLRSWPEVQKRNAGKAKETAGTLAWKPDLTPVGGTSYYFEVQLGSPSQTFALDLDTGSDFTWIQCQPCDPCMETRNPIFDPFKSNSRDVECSNVLCQDIDSHTCYPGEPKCTYSLAYNDGSVSNGELKSDLLHFSDDGTDTTIPISFGCGFSQHDMSSISGSDGVAGMCRSKVSLASQVSPHFSINVFAHCLVRYNSGSSSTFTIGERPFGVRYTPMVNGGYNTCYYYVNLDSITVGTQKLNLDPSQFQTDPDGHGGTIIDSSSVLTYLPQAAVDAIVKSLTTQVRLPAKRNYGALHFPLCFDVSWNKNPKLPDLVLGFSGADMTVKQEEAFVSSDNGNTLCLALGVAQAGQVSVVGSVFMGNQYVVYDNSNNEIGFAQWDCNTVNKD